MNKSWRAYGGIISGLVPWKIIMWTLNHGTGECLLFFFGCWNAQSHAAVHPLPNKQCPTGMCFVYRSYPWLPVIFPAHVSPPRWFPHFKKKVFYKVVNFHKSSFWMRNIIIYQDSWWTKIILALIMKPKFSMCCEHHVTQSIKPTVFF